MSTQIAEDNFYHIQQLPYVKQLIKENAKLKRRTKELKRLVKLISNNLPLFERGRDDDAVVVVEKKKVKVEVIDIDEIGVGPDIGLKSETNNIVLVVEEEAEECTSIRAATAEEIASFEKTPQQEEEAEEEEAEEEEAEEEEAEEEEAEEEEAEEEEAEEEEEEEAAEEEEAEEEEEAAEDEETEEEEEAEEDEEAGGVRGTAVPAEEEEEVYEVIIKGKAYYTSNEKSGVIYGIDSNGDVSLEVGVYKDGKPVFI